jgi:hypothetical protein
MSPVGGWTTKGEIMAYWTGEKIVCFETEPWPHYPGWLMVDCGCCAGIQWGGEWPDECQDCGGTGRYAQHIGSGALAQWPGGPFVGREVSIAV